MGEVFVGAFVALIGVFAGAFVNNMRGYLKAKEGRHANKVEKDGNVDSGPIKIFGRKKEEEPFVPFSEMPIVTRPATSIRVDK